MLQISAIPAFESNYHWLITDDKHPGKAYVVDPGDGEAVKQQLSIRKLSLCGILVTHRHWDHIDGIPMLLSNHNSDTHLKVYGPQTNSIPLVNHTVFENDSIKLFDHYEFKVLETPGHTLEHIMYYHAPVDSSTDTPILFCGDTLFGAGCGRRKDGTVTQFVATLERIGKLPEDTQIYCAHEYTVQNLAFAKNVEPFNPLIDQRLGHEKNKRENGIPTIPFALSGEKQTNPFLRLKEMSVINSVKHYWNTQLADEEAIFDGLRRWKDNF